MSVDPERSVASERRGPIRSPQGLVAGLALVALAGLALTLTSDLPQGTLSSMGPAMLPRWLAVGIGLCGLALVVVAFIRPGEGLERWSLRGPLLVILAILAFALTIRPFTALAFSVRFGPVVIGPFTTPGLGLIAAGPLAILIGGFASPEARLRELVVLALSLTPFCMLLFGDLLNLPIPLFPQEMAQLFPADWSQKQVLRVTAVLMAAAAAVAFLISRALGKRSAGAAMQVPDHSGRI